MRRFRPNEAAAILKQYAPWEVNGAPWPKELERAYQTFRAREFIANGWSPAEALKYTGIDVNALDPNDEEEEPATELSDAEGLDLLN